MTEKEAIAYIENCGWSKSKLGLSRTRILLEKLGNPQKKLRFVHVAGSNGKGSTCAMLASVLQTAGYRTGLYTSPYVQRFNERMRIDGADITGEELAQCTEVVRQAAENMTEHPTQFELVTAVAMLFFLQRQCDIVVLEVGMGGAHDATNIIEAPEVAVITNIGLEHTEYLGSTVEAIAETKGGIIKPGANCVCWRGDESVATVIRQICADKNVPLTFVEPTQNTILESDLSGQRFRYRDKEYHIGLLGKHQAGNAAQAVAVIESLRQKGFIISEDDLQKGLAAAKWPARFEVLCRDPLFILDGGHNPQCADALVNSLKSLLSGKKVLCILGMLRDKDVAQVIEIISPCVERFICLTPDSDRAMPADELAAMLKAHGFCAESFDTIEAGVDHALATADALPILAFGSLYMAGQVKSAVMKSE